MRYLGSRFRSVERLITNEFRAIADKTSVTDPEPDALDQLVGQVWLLLLHLANGEIVQLLHLDSSFHLFQDRLLQLQKEHVVGLLRLIEREAISYRSCYPNLGIDSPCVVRS